MRILNMRDKVTTFSIIYQIAYYSFRFIIYSICFYDRKVLQTYFFALDLHYLYIRQAALGKISK